MTIACSGAGVASTIDFEGGLGYTAADDMAISATTFDALGISISGGLSFESVGGGAMPATGSDPNEGFVTDNAPGGPAFDVDIDPINDLGGFFLRQTVAFDPGTSPLFTINWLLDPSSTVSGQIWDIDGTSPNRSEQWLLHAIYADGTTINVTSPEGVDNGVGSLDGRAWTFTFDPTSGTATDGALRAIEVSFVGNKSGSVGVAFDNLDTGIAPIPLPASGWLLLAAIGVGTAARKRALRS